MRHRLLAVHAQHLPPKAPKDRKAVGLLSKTPSLGSMTRGRPKQELSKGSGAVVCSATKDGAAKRIWCNRGVQVRTLSTTLRSAAPPKEWPQGATMASSMRLPLQHKAGGAPSSREEEHPARRQASEDAVPSRGGAREDAVPLEQGYINLQVHTGGGSNAPTRQPQCRGLVQGLGLTARRSPKGSRGGLTRGGL